MQTKIYAILLIVKISRSSFIIENITNEKFTIGYSGLKKFGRSLIYGLIITINEGHHGQPIITRIYQITEVTINYL